MPASLRKADLASALGSRFAQAFTLRERPAPELLPTGIPQIDTLAGGVPRGALTEIVGPASSGRTSLLLAILARATAAQEVCALVDLGDTFDPASAAAVGVRLGRLLWIRCSGPARPGVSAAEQALKSADWLIQGGGFGLIALDLAGISSREARRIPLTAWYRFQRAIEHCPTALVIVEPQPYAKTCASLILEAQKQRAIWTGAQPARLLEGVEFCVAPRKPVRPTAATFSARALG